MDTSTVHSFLPPSQFSSISYRLPFVTFHYLPRRRHHRRCLRIRSAAAAAESSPTIPVDHRDVFGPKKDYSGFQALVASIPPVVRFTGSAVFIAAATAAGFRIGLRIGQSRAAAIGGAVVLGAAGWVSACALNSVAPGVAAISLHNLAAGYDDPAMLRKEEVDAIVKRYGISKKDEAFKDELCDLYSRFVYSVLPPGGEHLKGNEVELIIEFKQALGIDDPDAASTHMEIGRQIFRQRLETGNHDSHVKQCQAFQKLVFVSSLVFGDATKFLLPWKRVFKVSDAEVDIAIRDNTQSLYALKLSSLNRDIKERQLIELRELQLTYKLSDEIAADMFRQRTRKLVEENIATALDILKSRTRASKGLEEVIMELNISLAFNDLLTLLKEHPEASRFAPGVEPVSLIAGEYHGDRKIEDLKLLYRVYAAESFPDARLDERKLVALNHLKNLFGFANHEAESIMLDITSKIYRKRLSKAFSGGDLEAAPSKAAFLQILCDELHLDPQKASEVHEEIYRQKLQQSVSDGELNEVAVAALLRLRVFLCIPQQTVDAVHADICGCLFEKVVKDAIASGVEGYDADVRAYVKKTSKGLRLSKEIAMDIASREVRKAFMKYVQQSKSAGNRIEAAKELKKMVMFNTSVATELISDIKGEASAKVDDPTKVEFKLTEGGDEMESVQTLRKTRPDKELEAKLGKPIQTEITLKDVLPQRDRADLYRVFFLSCLSGEVTVSTFGTQLPTKGDKSKYHLLNQLGDILGLSNKERGNIRRNIAEQEFKKRAKVILADGHLSKSNLKQLNAVQRKVGLPAEYTQKIIKQLSLTKLQAEIETAISEGKLGIHHVRDLKKQNIELDSMISECLRENLFKKTVEEIFSSGTGDFSKEEVYENIPHDLCIDPEKTKKVVQKLAMNRLSNSLVQAVALLRQRNEGGVVASLNDMLACDAAVPAEPLSWSLPEELADLYCVYQRSIRNPDKLTRLQYLLGVSESAAALLQDTREPASLLPLENEEEFVF